MRDHLRKGELERGREQLGYWWRVRGTVERGAGRGKGLGFPTAQSSARPGQDIAHGIYAVRVESQRPPLSAAGYVGPRPTFGDGQPVLEAYLLDFDGDLYGEEIEVEFIAQLRDDAPLPTEALADADARGLRRKRARAPRHESSATTPSAHFPLARARSGSLDCREPGC